jgi:hypothetical protein
VHGRHRYTASEARAMLEGSGFVVERLSYINSLLLPVVVGQRMIDRVRPSDPDGHSDLQPPGALINTALQSALYLEAAWLRDGGRFPAGLSILALARNEG